MHAESVAGDFHKQGSMCCTTWSCINSFSTAWKYAESPVERGGCVHSAFRVVSVELNGSLEVGARMKVVICHSGRIFLLHLPKLDVQKPPLPLRRHRYSGGVDSPALPPPLS